MAKKITQDENGEDMVEKVNQPDGAPIAVGESVLGTSTEVLSHKWQKDSPAIVTNTLDGYGKQDSILDKIDTEENLAKREAAEADKPEVSKADYDRRTKLDVSNPEYINSSLDHHEVTK